MIDINASDRLRKLELAKSLALENDYIEALSIIDNLLIRFPDDLDVLRLKGNILDLEIVNNDYLENEAIAQKLEVIKSCYERIIELSPHNTLALIDLADYWKNQGEEDKSLHYYDCVIDLLTHKHFYISLKDELQEAFEGKIDLLRQSDKQPQLEMCLLEAKKFFPDNNF